MAITHDKNQQVQSHPLRQFLDSLPQETAKDLMELFKQYSLETDEQIRSEIRDTIQEILIPDSLNVEMREEFDLDHEDPKIRIRIGDYRRKVGLEIKRTRLAASLSQEELADAVGISQSHICRLETGVHVPTFTTMERIADALGVEVEKLDPGYTSS